VGVQIVFEFREIVLLTAAVALFAIEAWAFVDAISRRPEVFVAADKQTKAMWMVILGVALGAHMLIWDPISILNIVGAIASLVYLVDVRPAVRSLSRR
jgi:hypothetical protein